MILSQELILSDKQAITASADSTNVIDLGVAGTPYGAVAPLNNDKGKGAPVPILVQVTDDFNNLTSLTVNISTGATTALGTKIVSQVIVLADLVAGKQFAVCYLPQDITERYLGIEYVVTGTAPSTGTVTAGITMGVQTNATGA